MTDTNKKKLSYEQKYLQRFNFKLNKKNEAPELLALWNAVDNKTSCLKTILSDALPGYLRRYQGMSHAQIAYLQSEDTPEYKEWAQLNSSEVVTDDDWGD